MVKILKTPLPKHEETLSPFIRDFVTGASSTPLPLLPQQLATFPSRWPFPRDDLYHWIPLLNRFDAVLEDFCKVYGLQDGPQTREFTCELLEREVEHSHNLKDLGYSEDGDRQVIESILNFSRLLLENCGNRTIYASSPLLSDLLNSTSLSLIVSTLQIGTQLAQRYQASFKRLSAPYRQHTTALLAIHYNINLDRVQQLAQPFIRTAVPTEPVIPATPATPSTKGKEKAYFNGSASSRTSIPTAYANELVSIARGGLLSNGTPNGQKNMSASVQSPSHSSLWDDWGDVRVTYYENQPQGELELTASTTTQSVFNLSSSVPPTPTPIRRSSTLGNQNVQRPSRLSNTDDASSPAVRAAMPATEDTQNSKPKAVEIPSSKVISTPIHELLKEYMPDLPTESKYELLTKLRVAKALTSTVEVRRQLLAVRILSITNLAYIHTEANFLEKVLKQDSDEPRRLQLIYQLADMIHPPTEGHADIPRPLQTIALAGLDALAVYQTKFQDICIALNTNINHGVLLYIVRKAVAEMAIDEIGDKVTEKDEWRGAVFSLLSHVATLPRAGSDMVTAGLVPILIEVLKLRTSIAERNYPMILDFLDAFIFNVRDAFQILVNAEGLPAISDLIIHEVKSASGAADAGHGTRPEYRSQSIDYEIPYFKQQSIKWLFKFIHHMMTQAGGYGGNFDRLLRNLIDSSPLLASLREIIGHASCFGSTVWTNAVRILNDFINNEPTSFAVIAEAGLSREFLEAITGKEIKMLEEPKDSPAQNDEANDASSPAHTDDESIISTSVVDDTTPHPPTAEMLEAPREGPLAQGIIPSAEAITIIPAAFGAICLNSSGMRMFQASNALQSFFEVFESPKHIQCFETDLNLPSNLGATFDELVRHHPPLKSAILNATLDMVARVAFLCKTMVSTESPDAKLWATKADGQIVVADENFRAVLPDLSRPEKGKGRATEDDMDVEMSGISNETTKIEENQSNTGKSMANNPAPYVYAVATFLSAMFSNSAVRTAFMEKGGSEHVLDLAELASLPYDFGTDKASRTLHTVIALLAEQKPHLILPSLLKRAQKAADILTPFAQYTQRKSGKAYFTPFVTGDANDLDDPETVDQIASGTQLVKAFVSLHSHTAALDRCLQPQGYNNHRSTVPSFTQVNLTDYYIQFVKSLGPLLAAATMEDFFLTKGGLVPAHWKKAVVTDSYRSFESGPVEDFMMGDTRTIITDATTGIETVAVDTLAIEDQITSGAGPTQLGEKPSSSSHENQTISKKERESPRFKNFKTLRYLLSKLPFKISIFFQALGRVSVTKRSHEPLQRLSNGSIPEAIAESIDLMLQSASDSEGSIGNYNSWTIMLAILRDVMIGPRQHERPFEVITAVLYAFKERGGFGTLNHLLEIFAHEIKQYSSRLDEENKKKMTGELMKLDLKHGLSLVGAKHILDLYLLLVTGKNIVEAPQTAAMTTRSERDRSRSEHFHFTASQFLVELRMAVLPTIRRLWDSDLIEKAINQIPNRLIDIIRVIAVADHEAGAYKREDKAQIQNKINRKAWKPNTENLQKLIEAGITEDLAKEALYRCNNSYTMASEYCKAQNSERSGGRHPIPQGVMDSVAEINGSSRVHTGPSTGASTPLVTEPPTMQLDEPVSEALASAGSSEQMGPPPVPTDPMAMSLDSLLSGIGRTLEEAAAANSSVAARQTPPSLGQQSPAANTVVVTIDDLNEERAKIRKQLIERCLDVINAHGEVTFEISDLITTVVDKSDDPLSMRKDIGVTLVNALMSFAMEDDVREVGKKVAAYAHLLALMLQNKPFYKESIGSLKDNLEELIKFVKLSPARPVEEPSPWVAHILLIIEILLSEDAQPKETEWNYPTLDTTEIKEPILKIPEPVVSAEYQAMLFDNIIEILPRIGKDGTLALAVLRVLVILTRSRATSVKMGEKKNIQRLFVMAKQLAGAITARLQSPLMLILRHIIEDEDTIKQIMRSEIKAFFEQPRTQRHIDVSTYLRQLSHLVIRAPVLFVDVTNEMVKLGKWSPNAADSPGRQQIVLQDSYSRIHRLHTEATTLTPLQATGLLTLDDVKPTTEAAKGESTETTKPAPIEHKAPVIENPDGVIHFLLCELLNYKGEEDKDAAIPSIDKLASGSANMNIDISMADISSPIAASTPSEAKDAKKMGRQEFKVEDHPIYVYRCFLLKCLTELLLCYNRTKIEFINFKRSAPPLPMTPSKPRSIVVNYLLSDLIPIGTLDHAETTVWRKKMATSSWADSLLTALLSKTGEQLVDRDRDPTDADDEPDLLFVRKFILENVLKAYKDATSSSEPLDIKYARMLSLADLMNHIMQGKETPSVATDPSVSNRSTLQLRRIMFDKGFIAALTGSIADIDLNFPGAKRAVKHILRPLKTLTQTAIDLSDAGKISLAPGQGEEDEIASASSVSELDEGREETPDLFRNSTLGMFEPGRDGDSSSNSEDDDEDMYEGDFDEQEMEYDDEMGEDEEDNISDDDEELEGMGEIEGLSGDHAVDVEVIMEEEDEEEEDDDDDEDNSEDEDDEDSDDMDGVDDEDARVEIVDEDGNTHPLGEADEGDEWQSDDDEEEDYEGRAVDEEEDRDHEMGHIARGAIGHLVRALGGDDHEGAVEILQRMEDEGIEQGDMELEGYLEDGQDEDEDDEDDDDMDDDDGIYDDYTGAPPGMAFEWNGEAAEPPLPMIISHRGHHRPRHGIPSPFGYFTAGTRDPLGGMFDPLPELHNLLEMESSAAAGIDHAQTALSRAQTEVEGGDHFGNALSTARSALQEARARLTALQGLVSGVITMPTNFNTNAPPVPEVYRGFSPYRSHRPGPTPRGNDDGTNPLLQRSAGLNLSRDISARPSPMGSPLAAIRSGDGPPNFSITATGSFSEGPAALLNDLITSLPLPGHLVARHGHQLHFQFTGGPRSEMTRDLQALFGTTRGGIPRLDGRREPTVEPGNAASFNILSTAARWTDEAKLLFGNAHPEKAYQRVHLAVMAVLVPPAIKLEMEARRIAEEMKKKHDEEERLAKEAKEKREAEEKAEKERREAEERVEREAAERAMAEEAAAAGAATASQSITGNPSEAVNVQPMEGVEVIEANAVPASAEEGVPAEGRARVTTIIRGNQIDITDLGIDPDFLRELPEELREEVITSTIAERRSQAAAGGAEPSEIDQEFLDALPAEIRDEIIQQERQDRRRREREEQRRQASGSAAPAAGPQEMDAASILATLPPALRQQILMEQDEEILSHLGPEFIAQARAGARDLPLSHVRNMTSGRPRTAAAVSSGVEQTLQKPQRRTVVQMLDKAGVATLLRLMFVFQQDSLRSTLFQVLQNISENRHNRSEVISTLLHILQDGSTDMAAVERSFAHLSLRAKQPKDKELKTQQPLKRNSTGMSLHIVPNTDVSPLMVVQQCLSTLIYLSKVNFHVPSFFLTEHDASGSLKRSASRKGKAKETRASKYALNYLLTLLDRKLIMESSSVMESLSDLLSRVTAPLQALERKQKEAAMEAKNTNAHIDVQAPTTATSEATPETAAGTELQPELMETDGDAATTSVPSEHPVEVAVENINTSANDVIVPVAEQSKNPIASNAKESDQKKQRPFVPPVIPEANLKLVINIFIARECSAKTFRETLSTIKNLSCIPGAKAVFGKELIRKAQELGDTILFDLDELLPQIQRASSGTEIQGVALVKFSPSGSDQNKLLRVLTALDHLFDPKNTPKTDNPAGENAETAEDDSKEVEKQDLLAILYENPTFGPMWEKLSACLSAIRQRENMLNVATILLPLIESLMVVCKNTTLKDVPIARSQVGRELGITSPQPESRMENLFFTFTEEHRKILNDLVRHTPKLMSGTFSLLVKNPKVLEFDNKRNYFTRSIHNRNSQTRQSFPPLQLSVRREQVFHDSFKSLYFKSGDEMKFGKLSIRFHGEEGVDAGGVTREWFQVLSRQMFDPGYALFIPVSSDKTTFHPNHMSGVNPEHLSFFKFIGRVIGKALYEGRVLDCHFSRAVYKRILGKSVSVKDMESLDPEYYKSLVWMLENDITDIITETFSVDNDKFGVIETVDLIERGRNILVTQENKQEYIRLIVEFKLIGSVQEQLNEFLKGFHEIIPAELIAIFNEQELELLISGLPDIDVDDWKSNTEYHNYTGASPQIQWFWRAIRSFDKEERAKLLQFVTGTSKVPLNGFKELEGMNGFSRFNIHRDYGNKDRLPSSHTCFNQLDLPEYESYETLRHQVLTAITAGSEYFGFA